MKTLAALTLTTAVMFAATPVQANPATEALQQLAANQLIELKITVAQQARQAIEQAAVDVRELFQADVQVVERKQDKAITEPKSETE